MVPTRCDSSDKKEIEMKLRTYQEECIDAIEQAGPGNWLCQMATGLGKTVTFARCV